MASPEDGLARAKSLIAQESARGAKAHAHVFTEGPDRERLWAAHKAQHPGFADYEQKTSRVIPAISLERIDQTL